MAAPLPRGGPQRGRGMGRGGGGMRGGRGGSYTSWKSAVPLLTPEMILNHATMTDSHLCNDGFGPLVVPGFSDIPIDLEFYPQNRFTHGVNEWAQWPNLTARELAMLDLMNDLTEEHLWHEKVFNEDLVTDWRTRALSRPLVSPRAWDWCLAELRDKASYFEQTANTLVFNTGAGVVKSDAVAENIQVDLRVAAAAMFEARNRSKQQIMHNLVDPGLFPLVYGRTRVLVHSRRSNLDELLNHCGQGEVVPELPSNYFHRERPVLRYSRYFEGVRLTTTTDWDKHHKKWSARFQLLPCEVEFENESGTEVRITSYVNNLHPVRFRALYGTIANLISRSIEPWNQILIKEKRGRTPLRIRTYGVEPQHQIPEWATLERLKELERDRNSTAFRHAVENIKQWLALPDEDEVEETEDNKISPTWEKDDDGLLKALVTKRNRLRLWQHPEPGTSFSYDEWKAGRVKKPIINRKIERRDTDDQHKFYRVALQDSFRKQGLQVVVKIRSVDLTPENPSFDGTDWQLDGMINDHIVASALYVFDVNNVTETRLAFRQETRMDERDFRYYSWDYMNLVAVFAITGVTETSHRVPSLQELGSVSAPQGRLLVWPNVLHHWTEPIRLIDATKSGHCRSISLHLVDPHYRVCSTRNVPPQQHDWWVGEALEATGAAEHGIPPELMNQIDADTDDWPMGMEEAERLGLELEQEQDTADEYIMTSGADVYTFYSMQSNRASIFELRVGRMDGNGIVRDDGYKLSSCPSLVEQTLTKTDWNERVEKKALDTPMSTRQSLTLVCSALILVPTSFTFDKVDLPSRTSGLSG